MGRPAKAMISKSMAAKAALKIIDSKGLEGLNLQLVAKELGVKAPSLYYHFENRAELLEEVAKKLMMDIVMPTPPEVNPKNWKEALISTCITVRKSILTHPNAAPLMLRFFPRHLMLTAYDKWISTYHNVPTKLHLIINDGLEKITFGSILVGSTSRAHGKSPMPDIDPEEHLFINKAIQANTLNEEQIFEETLKRFLATF